MDDAMSVDLLNDTNDNGKRGHATSGGNNDSKLQQQQKNTKETPSPQGRKSPLISPATQTLNTMSQDVTSESFRFETAATIGTKSISSSQANGRGNRNKIIGDSNDFGQARQGWEEKRQLTTTGDSVGVGATDNGKDSVSKKIRGNGPCVNHRETAREGASIAGDAPLVVQSEGLLNWRLLERDWELHPIHIDEMQGKLGLSILRGNFTGDVTSSTQTTTREFITPNTTEEPEFCKAYKVVAEGLAGIHGVQVGDWICHPLEETTGEFNNRNGTGDTVIGIGHNQDVHLAKFEQVQELSKKRPFRFLALRPKRATSNKKVLSSHNGSSSSAASAPSTSRDRCLPSDQDSMSKLRKDQEKVHPSRVTESNTRNLPNKVTNQNFQGQTSQNASAQSNGQGNKKKKLASSTQVENGKDRINVPFCLLCNYAGRGNKAKAHHAWCHKNKFFGNSGADAILKRIQKGRQLGCPSCENEFKRGRLYKRGHTRACLRNQDKLKQAKAETERKRKEENKIQSGKNRKIGSPTSSSDDQDDEEEEEEDGSVYRPAKRRRVNALSINPAPVKQTKVTARSKASNKKKSSKEASVRVTPSPAEDLAAPSKNKDAVLRSNWVDYHSNPWGPSGHVEGDVLLFGMSGFSSYETLLPSERYKLNPFEESSGYLSTHVTPEEGLTFLKLTRDPMAKRPWGFRVGKDEFGQGCLVEAVDPLSPASSAVR